MPLHQRKATVVLRLLSVFLLMLSIPCNAANLAIIIDDIGNSEHDFQALKLPSEVAFSLLPFTPQALTIGQQAWAQNRDMLLHIPMEAVANNQLLGPGALRADMSEQELKHKLEQAIIALPFIQGMNNHMGSKLTTMAEQMRWTMETLRHHELFFLDSRTSKNTLAESTAQSLGVPVLRRHVFLDNLRSRAAIEKQFNLALKLARSGRDVVIIGHPYPETLSFLQQRLSQPIAPVNLVNITELMPLAEAAIAKTANENGSDAVN
ncbi:MULTISPECIES: divergent polysaccharide deacetylase family protein [unclassified Motilimonas]|uniref:divergent polysaccharide deacetylase family protein n=1 Tax=Motilimonas TaxID=1914248 RepID=UPI001E2907E9|nr:MULTISPECIES: divergent polysaccharide deacetylase family protein [unclassified Motilimonas]MCE0557348.1 divergent polysaccharide deacetylase family protein [Motilimonas sp. E26]MDO6527336.1 divergent polysaccharide deacetylase family protein [Motilimonas sp. 1_MG-2023]